jgi:Major tropism determinant N-terminal domain/Pectate lyase superfamily protein
MATQLKLRRGTAAQTAAFTGAQGEVTIKTDTKEIVVHDGVTPGGWTGGGFLPAGTGVVATTVQAKLREDAISAKAFGAVGDGVVDDYAALQAWLTYAQNNGGRYFLPKGRYRTTQTLKIGYNFTTPSVIEIFGDGQGWVADGTGETNGSLIVGDTGALVLDLSGANTMWFHDWGIVSGTINPSTCGMMAQRVASDRYTQRMRFERVAIAIATAPSSNIVGTPTVSSAGGVSTVTGYTGTSAVGSIALLNKRGEHWTYKDCDFYADNPFVLDGASNYKTSATGYTLENEAYPTLGGTTTLHDFVGGFFYSASKDCVVFGAANQITMDTPYFSVVDGMGAITAFATNEVYIRAPAMEAAFGSTSNLLGYFAKFLSDCSSWDLGSVRTNATAASTTNALYSAPGALINSRVVFGNSWFGKLANGTIPGAVLKNVELIVSPGSGYTNTYTLATTATNVRVRQQTDEQAPTLTLVAAGWTQASTQQRVNVTKDGRLVTVQFFFQTTLSGASGASADVVLTGLPYTSVNQSNYYGAQGLAFFSQITKAGYTQFGAYVGSNSSQITIQCSGSGVAGTTLKNTDLTAGVFYISGTVIYQTAP